MQNKKVNLYYSEMNSSIFCSQIIYSKMKSTDEILFEQFGKYLNSYIFLDNKKFIIINNISEHIFIDVIKEIGHIINNDDDKFEYYILTYSKLFLDSFVKIISYNNSNFYYISDSVVQISPLKLTIYGNNIEYYSCNETPCRIL